MTALQYVENVIRAEWENEIDGRPHDVGELEDDIKIVYESDKDWRRMDLANYDYLTITDGGIVGMTPQSFGWLQEDIEATVTVDIRTKGHPDRPGRISLYGERGAGNLEPNEAPRWGGLVGEVMRIFKAKRKGDEEFSLVDMSEVNDLSGQMGGQIWRATVSIGLETRSSTIDTSV